MGRFKCLVPGVLGVYVLIIGADDFASVMGGGSTKFVVMADGFGSPPGALDCR